MMQQERRCENFALDERRERVKRSLMRGDGSVFGIYDETTIRLIGNRWTKNSGNRFYIDVPAAAELLGLSVKDFKDWNDKTYFNAATGEFVFDGRKGNLELEEKLERPCMRKDAPQLTQRERRSLERDSECYFGKYDETKIRMIGKKWKKEDAIRFYIDIPAAAELLGLSVRDFGDWNENVNFDAVKGQFVFYRNGDRELEKKLKEACLRKKKDGQ